MKSELLAEYACLIICIHKKYIREVYRECCLGVRQKIVWGPLMAKYHSMVSILKGLSHENLGGNCSISIESFFQRLM